MLLSCYQTLSYPIRRVFTLTSSVRTSNPNFNSTFGRNSFERNKSKDILLMHRTCDFHWSKSKAYINEEGGKWSHTGENFQTPTYKIYSKFQTSEWPVLGFCSNEQTRVFLRQCLLWSPKMLMILQDLTERKTGYLPHLTPKWVT